MQGDLLILPVPCEWPWQLEWDWACSGPVAAGKNCLRLTPCHQAPMNERLHLFQPPRLIRWIHCPTQYQRPEHACVQNNP